MTDPDLRAEVRAFLATRRARLDPEQVGLADHGGRRVPGLRREEVATLAGISFDYYVRLERGNLAGTSRTVLDAVASALRLNHDEHNYLNILGSRFSRTPVAEVPAPIRDVHPSTLLVLNSLETTPAWIQNHRHDVVAMNPSARVLYATVLTTSDWPINMTRFVYQRPEDASELFTDYADVAHQAAAMLRLEAARHPHDHAMKSLIDQLSESSEHFRRRWASHDVAQPHRSRKRMRHPVEGETTFNVETLPLSDAPSLWLHLYGRPSKAPAHHEAP